MNKSSNNKAADIFKNNKSIVVNFFGHDISFERYNITNLSHVFTTPFINTIRITMLTPNEISFSEDRGRHGNHTFMSMNVDFDVNTDNTLVIKKINELSICGGNYHYKMNKRSGVDIVAKNINNISTFCDNAQIICLYSNLFGKHGGSEVVESKINLNEQGKQDLLKTIYELDTNDNLSFVRCSLESLLQGKYDDVLLSDNISYLALNLKYFVDLKNGKNDHINFTKKSKNLKELLGDSDEENFGKINCGKDVSKDVVNIVNKGNDKKLQITGLYQ